MNRLSPIWLNVFAIFCAFSLALLTARTAAAQDAASPAEANFKQHCASCHGQDLRGGSAQSMVDGVWQFGGDEGAITRNIKFGISGTGMPDYQKLLNDDQIRDLAKYVADTAERSGIQRPPLPTLLQTRHYDVGVEKWCDGELDTPWGMVFTGPNSALVTEISGRLRVITDGKLDPQPIAGTPKVLHEGQGGLLDVAIDPEYPTSGWVYLAYSHGDNRGGAMTRVARGKIRDHQWVDEQIIYAAPPHTYGRTRHHYGSRIAFDAAGKLYFSVGERGIATDAQELGKPGGKIHRIERNGSIPADNPFVNRAGALSSIFTYGNRNAQGLALDATTGKLWESEHGPMGGDEINIILSGKNYGWPIASFGIDYSGRAVTDKLTLPSVEPPVSYWVPSIAVCGMDFCTGAEFPQWEHNLIVGGLGHEELRRLVIANDRVLHQELLMKNAGRVRDVVCGPDGKIYVLLNKPDTVLRLNQIAPVLRQ